MEILAAAPADSLAVTYLGHKTAQLHFCFSVSCYFFLVSINTTTLLGAYSMILGHS